MKVLMTGGGTGGHVNPALAIADTIKTNIPGSVIEFVGTSRGIENKLVAKAGYRLHHIEIRGLRRSLSLSNIKTAYYVLTSPAKAAKLINSFKPDVVIGTGGYVCWPVIKAAAEKGIPTALHESNAVPGVAVKMLASKVDRIYLNFESTAEFLPCKEKLLHVGNPLKSSFSGVTKKEAREKLGVPEGCRYFLLSYGGSLGAEKINGAMLRFMKNYTSRHPEIYHLHASGSGEHAECAAEFAAAGLDRCENLKLVEYIYDMPYCMAASDVVVCRAGAMTVSEVSAAGKCAVFVPSPNVTNNHQYKNAKVLCDDGAAFVFEESELEGGAESGLENKSENRIENGFDNKSENKLENKFEEKLAFLLSKEGDECRRETEERIKKFSSPDAAKLIYKDIVELVEGKKKGTGK